MIDTKVLCADPSIEVELPTLRRPFLKALATSLLPISVHVSASPLAINKGRIDRHVVVHLETTGIDLDDGDRVLEIGMVEIIGSTISESTFHSYLNPERHISLGASLAHGIEQETVANMPRFARLATLITDFICGSELVVVLEKFSVGFLNAEFARLDRPPIGSLCPAVVETWRMAKAVWPEKKNDLDSVSTRLGVPITSRDALTTAMQIAKTYLALAENRSLQRISQVDGAKS